MTRIPRPSRKVIENHGLDFKYASAGPGAIVYEQFGSIHLYDLKTRQRPQRGHSSVRRPGGAASPLRASGGPHSERGSCLPTGLRAVFEARGEIVTVPAEKGDIRNLTNTPGAQERMPAWSPDGKKIAYLSDESGEYALHIRDQNGMGDVLKIDLR